MQKAERWAKNDNDVHQPVMPAKFWKKYIPFTLIVLAFIVSALDVYHLGGEIAPLDTGAYIANAREVQRIGGVAGMLRAYFSGESPVRSQMPFYVGLLSLFRLNRFDGLIWARLSTAVLGLGGLMIIYLYARRVFGRATAFLAVTLMVVNLTWLAYSTLVACEILLAIWITLAWLCMLRYAKSGRWGAQMGVFAGLALMTKVTGVLLLPAIGAVFFWREKTRLWKSRAAWGGALAFLLISLPLTVCALQSKPVPDAPRRPFLAPLWYSHPEAYRMVDAENQAPSFSDYWQRHGFRGSMSKLMRGSVQEGIFYLIATGETYLFGQRLGFKVWPMGLMLFGLAALAIWKDFRMTALATCFTSGAFLLFFSWFVWDHIRFIFPITPLVLLLAARGAQIAWRRVRDSRFVTCSITWSKLALGISIVLACSTVALAVTSESMWRDPRKMNTPPGYFELLRWLQEHCEENTTYLMGPSHDYNYFWADPINGQCLVIPYVSSPQELQSYIIDRNVRYVILDVSTLRQREQVFAGFMHAEGKVVRVDTLPFGWQPVFSNHPRNPAVIVFRIAPFAP